MAQEDPVIEVRAEKSTNGRTSSKRVKKAPRRPLSFRALHLLSPALAERLAAWRFGKTDRSRAPAIPHAPGLVATAFEVTSRDQRLAAWSWGNDRAPIVLLVHGWNGSAAQLAGMVEPLVGAGYRVVAFDQPAHGTSTGTRTTLVAMADAVRDVALAVGPVAGIIAHSLGASAAALAVSRGTRTGSLILIAPPAEVTHFVRAFTRFTGLPDASIAGVLERLRLETGASADDLDIRKLAPAMQTPLLVLHDLEDHEVPFEHGRAIADAWPGARLVPLRGLGHRGPVRNPRVIASALGFLGDPRPRPESNEDPDVDFDFEFRMAPLFSGRSYEAMRRG